eukprot:8901953-Alexandrium_andersonii.AAC.1
MMIVLNDNLSLSPSWHGAYYNYGNDKGPKPAQTRPLELTKGPFCAVSRAEREYGNENLPGAPQGSLCAVVRAGRGG